MKRLRQRITYLRDLVRFTNLPRDQRRLVVYCENRNYWPHLDGLIRHTLASSDTPICFFSSDPDDPGLSLEHPNFRRFQVDEGSARNWLFANIDTDVMVMTMPDLNQYQVKKSRHSVHYVYVQHSLVSLHMIYRAGAFDHYDTLFCAGPHHVEEARAMEAAGDLPARNLVEHGYSRLDAILAEAARRPRRAREAGGKPTHVLVAPSWGPRGLIETHGELLVETLLGAGFQVTLRPHPQTFKLSGQTIDAILGQHGESPLFELEKDVAGQESLHQSDVMVSDWSGAALDYAFGLEKPVLFVDVPRKVNNPGYEKLGLEPFEASVRERIGGVLAPDDLGGIAEALGKLSHDARRIGEIRDRATFNVGGADRAGARALIKILSGSLLVS